MFYSTHSDVFCELICSCVLFAPLTLFCFIRATHMCYVNEFVSHDLFSCFIWTLSCSHVLCQLFRVQLLTRKPLPFNHIYMAPSALLSLTHSFSHTLSHILQRSLSLLLVLPLVLSFYLSLVSLSPFLPLAHGLSSCLWLSRTLSLSRMLTRALALPFSLSFSSLARAHRFLQVGELRKFAETHKIDISDCLQKDEIVSRVMQSM